MIESVIYIRKYIRYECYILKLLTRVFSLFGYNLNSNFDEYNTIQYNTAKSTNSREFDKQYKKLLQARLAYHKARDSYEKIEFDRQQKLSQYLNLDDKYNELKTTVTKVSHFKAYQFRAELKGHIM